MSGKKTRKRVSLDFEIEFYEKLLAEKPDFPQALMALAEAYTKIGRYQQGLELDEKLCRLKPEDGLVYYNLACSYSLTQNIDKALSALRQAIELGYSDFKFMDTDPDLTLLRQDNRYDDLISNLAKEKRSRDGMDKVV